MTATQVQERPITDRAVEALRRSGNPFRNYFARNPDDEVCARYHVADLYAAERRLLLSIIDLYRYDPTTHSEMVPVLGNKGAGKTHLLHSIKHGGEDSWQLLVTPGVYQKDSDFLEYLLFQVMDTLLGGGKQKGARPLEFVGEELVRRHIYQGFTRGVLLNDEADLANFLTFGFAELEFQVRPSRQDLVLALLKVLMSIFLDLRIPVVIAFDQLEDLLLARRTDDGH